MRSWCKTHAAVCANEVCVIHFLLSLYLQVPDTGGVEEGWVHLPHPVNVSHVPHIQTVVIIYAAEPVADGVVSNSNGVWVTDVLLDGKQMSDGREIRAHC